MLLIPRSLGSGQQLAVLWEGPGYSQRERHAVSPLESRKAVLLPALPLEGTSTCQARLPTATPAEGYGSPPSQMD